MRDTGKGQMNRRRLIAGLAAAGASTLGVGARVAGAAVSPAGLALTAWATEGPYYLAASPDRADITEGLKGVPLELRLTVQDAGAAVLAGVRVDVWHCDTKGNYSGFGDRGDAQGARRRYLRGTQRTDAAGVAAFRTIYPGWYFGRTTHIHFKVLDGTRTLLTSQLLLPDALSEFLYGNVPDYRRDAVRDTLNSNDGIGLTAGTSLAAAVREDTDRYVASLDVVVDRSGNRTGRGGSGGRRNRNDASGRIGALVPG